MGACCSRLSAEAAHAIRSTSLSDSAHSCCAFSSGGRRAISGDSCPEGSGTYRVYLMDAVSRLTPEQLEKGANYEVR